jgi:hypothetical protein
MITYFSAAMLTIVGKSNLSSMEIANLNNGKVVKEM